jgi:hypothetical protein
MFAYRLMGLVEHDQVHVTLSESLSTPDDPALG